MQTVCQTWSRPSLLYPASSSCRIWYRHQPLRHSTQTQHNGPPVICEDKGQGLGNTTGKEACRAAAEQQTRGRSINAQHLQPQRVSNLGGDGAARTPRTAPKLTSLAEREENDDMMPGAFPQSASPAANNTPTRSAKRIVAAVSGQTTPKQKTPIKPSGPEMHPQKFMMSTAKPLDEARWLGFSSMAPHTEPPKGADKISVAQGTPTRAHKPTLSFDHPPKFDFTFSRPSLGLSPEARKLMVEKRGEAAKIKEQMLASQDDANPTADDVLARRMATPRGKVSRFSDVHMAHFKKMDSIANHPSAFRADTKSSSDANPFSKPEPQPDTNATRSLKRTQAKAGLASSSATLPKPVSRGTLDQPSASDMPAKRVKRAADDDAATSRPKGSGSDTPSTPRDAKGYRLHANNPILTKGSGTPTAAALARAASVKSAKRTMIPGLTRSPSKPGMTTASLQQARKEPALLARSPSKMTIPRTTKDLPDAPPESPLLSRSPVKPPMPDKAVDETTEEHVMASTKIPFLARSPSKMTVADKTEGQEKPSKTPLLARSPSKIAIPTENPFSPAKTPGKSAGTNLMTRFNLLRKSPVKSILRTPQRLYSDDPVKVASGTHFSTPEKVTSGLDKPAPAVAPKTAPVLKHVDFTASTKGTNEKSSGQETPSKTPVQQRTSFVGEIEATEEQPRELPALPTDSKNKGNRRMTMAVPSDFTFRAGDGITFAPSLSRPSATAAHKDLKASIRHVSAEPVIIPAANRKRKFVEEDGDAEPARPAASTTPIKQQNANDKENDDAADDHRPTKKAKTSAPEPAAKPAKTPMKKIPTLGVKPKSSSSSSIHKSASKDKRAGTLSQARLAMLATPKHRR